MLRSETAGSPDRLAAALAGLRAFQQAERSPVPPPRPVVGRAGRVSLRDHGGSGHGGSGRPVVFVPSLINPPAILDLAPDLSLIDWVAARGHRALLCDWGVPKSEDRDLDVGDHVALLASLLRGLDAPAILVGYCLGGTMALAAAAQVPVAGLAAIATPWHFAGYGAQARATIADLWKAAEPGCARLGLVPMEVLQSGFWQLDPGRTIGKYEAFGRMTPDGVEARAFVTLEDWANAGAPLPYAVGRQLFEDFIAADLPGEGRWTVAGAAVDPARLACPTIEFVSLTDRIVPAATAAGLPDRRDLGAGHVGMIVGRAARVQLWEPLADWIAALPSPR